MDNTLLKLKNLLLKNKFSLLVIPTKNSQVFFKPDCFINAMDNTLLKLKKSSSKK